MPLTKAELIKALQEDKSPMDTPISIYLECTNDDQGIYATSVDSAAYDKRDKEFLILGTYEIDVY